MASPHSIASLVWRVAKKNKTQVTPNNDNNENNNDNCNNNNKKTTKGCMNWFQLRRPRDHWFWFAFISTVNKTSFLNWFIYPNTVKNHIYTSTFFLSHAKMSLFIFSRISIFLWSQGGWVLVTETGNGEKRGTCLCAQVEAKEEPVEPEGASGERPAEGHFP